MLKDTHYAKQQLHHRLQKGKVEVLPRMMTLLTTGVCVWTGEQTGKAKITSTLG